MPHKWLLLIGLLTPLVAAATDIRFFNVIYENDIFYQEDGGYTNGFAVNYARGFDRPFDEDNSPSLLVPLLNRVGMNNHKYTLRGISYQLGQVISTPEDITQSNPQPEQQPYAGLLMGRINFYTMDYNTSNRLGLVLGVVGPPAGARESQQTIHSLTGSAQPQGWQYQLHTEPVVRLEGARSRRLWGTRLSDSLEMDIASIGEAGVGNLLSNIAWGLRWRFGAGLWDSFPVAMDLPGREVNPTAGMSGNHWQVFINAEARYEFNNLLIEGNTFRDSYGVPLNHEQARLGFGVAFNIGDWALVYEGALSTKAYPTQPGIGKFGALSITYRLQ